MDQNQELALAHMRESVQKLGSSTEVRFDHSFSYQVKVSHESLVLW